MKKYTEIELHNQTLRGYHHQSNNHKVVVMLHGFTGNKSEAKLLFANLSNRLEEQGFDSIRMDFFGHGESDGQFKDMTLNGLNMQVQAIIEYARSFNYDEYYLLGFSMGGMLALLNLDALFKKVVLLSPAIKMPELTKRMFEESPLKNGNADIGGLELSRNFYISMKDVNVFIHQNHYQNPMLFVVGNKDIAVPYQDVVAASEMFQNTKLKVYENCDHLYSSVLLREELYQSIIKFLKN